MTELVRIKGFAEDPNDSGKLVPIDVEIRDPEIIAKVRKGLVEGLSISKEKKHG